MEAIKDHGLIGDCRAAALRGPNNGVHLKGPTVTRQLEPPGFLALNYGIRTPVSVLLAHIVFGAIVGAFYAL